MAPRTLATVTDYDGLVMALRARIDQLNIARCTVDEASGFADGYSAKLLGRKRGRALGVRSLGPLLHTLGLVLIVAEASDGRNALQSLSHGARIWCAIGNGNPKPLENVTYREKIREEEKVTWTTTAEEQA